MNSVYINDISVFLPNAPVSNEHIESVLGQAGPKPSRAKKLVLRSNGIEQRHYAIDPATGQATHNNAQLTAEAIRGLDSDSFSLNDLDCLVCGTSLPDQLLPNHAVMVHGELACPPCEVVATAGVCLAGIAALKYAYLSIKSGDSQSAIASGSETASAVMRAEMFEGEIADKVERLGKNPEIAFEKDFLRWMLSDGSGAVLLQNSMRESGISLRIDWIEKRSYANEQSACMYAGANKLADGSLQGWRAYEPRNWIDDSVFSIKQDVKQLNEDIIPYTVERLLAEVVEKHDLQAADIDYFLPHYSSEFFREKVYQGLQAIDFPIPYQRWFTNLATKGNTGSASIYIMLEELFKSGQLKAGEKLLCYVPESGRFASSFMLLTVCG